MLENLVVGLCAADLPQIKREVFVEVPIEIVGGKEVLERLHWNFVRHRKLAEAICSRVVFTCNVEWAIGIGIGEHN